MKDLAALMLVADGAGRVLSVSRDGDPNNLGFPGGHIEDGEAPSAAAARELHEETGVTCHESEKLFDAPAQDKPDSRVHVFRATKHDAQVAKLAAEPGSHVRWAKPEEFSDAECTFAPFVREHGAKLFGHLARREAKTVRSTIYVRSDAPGRALVEGKPPTAFRIWRAGANETDHGTHYFTRDSAALLMAAQSIRGNKISVDVDHMSLSKGEDAAPPEARKAVGWHVLEVREDENGEPECWAGACEWTDVVAPGLAKDPPEWRYFSPAYDVDPETGEIVRYLNTALTNNPATWRVTTLASVASHSEDRMSYADTIAALKKMAEGDDEDGKKAKAALAALEPDGDEKPADEKKDAEEDKPADEKKETVAAAADEEDKPADEKKDPVAATVAASVKAPGVEVELAKHVVSLDARLADLERTTRKEKRAAILASRQDLPATLRATLAVSKLETVERIVASIPKPKVRNLAAAEQSTVSAKAPVGDASKTARAVDPTVKASIDRKMGRVPVSNGIVKKGNVVELGTLGADEARAKLAEKNKGADAPGKVA